MNEPRAPKIAILATGKNWNCMKDLFSNNHDKPGMPQMSANKTLSGIMFELENESKWRFIPGVYGKPSTIFKILAAGSANYAKWLELLAKESGIERTLQLITVATNNRCRRDCNAIVKG